MYIEELTIEQPPEFTFRVLVYEIGHVSQLMVYMERFGKTGYLGDLETALADSLTMQKLLCEQLGFNDIAQLERDGLERFKHRMGEVKKAALIRKFGDGSQP